MGILASFLQNAMQQQPPNPIGGGSPFGQPGAWPSGVPNPLGLPSPGDAWNTFSGWFTNPYGTNGSVPDPSPYGGINPYGTQVSGPKWESGATYRPPDPNALASGWTFGNYDQGYQNKSMSVRPPDMKSEGDVAGPYAQQQGWTPGPAMKQAPAQQETGGHMGGGFGTGGPWGQQWLYQMNNRGPWQHVQMGSPYYGK